MRDERLEAARTYLNEVLDSPISDQVILGLFAAIKGKKTAIYEKNDFVAINMGMGEAGHGWIQSSRPGGYRVKIWSHDPKEYPEYVMFVGEGDMRGLSTIEEAMDYYLERSGQK